MFSYQQISRWLTNPPDPMTVEDWVANRELFGSEESKDFQEEEMELAYQIEKARAEKPAISEGMPLEVILNGLEISGIAEIDDTLIVAPIGKPIPSGKQVLEVQLVFGGDNQKIKVNSSEILRIRVKTADAFGVYVRCLSGFKIGNQNVGKWNGSGKKYVVIDARGRPIPIFDGQKQEEIVALWRAQMTRDTSDKEEGK